MKNAAANNPMKGYTPVASDLKKELRHYEAYFRGKTIYSCFDEDYSSFVEYFTQKKDVGKYFYTDESDNPALNLEKIEEADVICTCPNPSEFRNLIRTCVVMDKYFLLLGNINILGCIDMFKLFHNNKIFLGHSRLGVSFMDRRKKKKKRNNFIWITNMKTVKKPRREQRFFLAGNIFHSWEMQTYDNYQGALDVPVVNNMPIHYEGEMGVPVEFLDKYNPEQFDIVGLDRLLSHGNPESPNAKECRFFIKGKEMPARIVIRRT